MNKFKTLFSSVALAALALTTSVVSAAYVDDAKIPSYAKVAVEELTKQGVFRGYGDTGEFRASRELNRAEISKIIVLATGIELKTNAASTTFPDVKAGDWFYNYVNTMAAKGWINGYPDGNFKPANPINRAEFAKMVVNAFGIEKNTAGTPHFTDVPGNAWFHDYVETLYNHNIMKGFSDGTFKPAENVTRAETAYVVYEAQKKVADSKGNAKGTLEVELSSKTARGTKIPYNATAVPFTTVEFTASDDADVKISGITIKRLGLGDYNDFAKVWLEIDGFKIGNDKSVNSSDQVELTFNPSIVVPAGKTLVADIVASMDGKADNNGKPYDLGHVNRLAIISAESVTSTASNVTGQFPIEGQEMEVANYKVSNLMLTPMGTNAEVKVGDQFAEIGKFKLQNESSRNRAIEVRAITLKNMGSAEIKEVLANAVLYVAGKQVSVGKAIIDGDYITFRLDNGTTGGYVITDGLTKIFSIRADIAMAEKNDKIQFKVDNYEDVVAIESNTAFGVRTVSKTKYNSTTKVNESVSTEKDAEDAYATLTIYSVKSGDLNVSRDPSSKASQDVAQTTTDVELLKARIVAEQPVKVDGVKIKATENNNGGATPAFDGFKLYVNGKLVDSVEKTAGGYLVFKSAFEITGTSVLEVKANVDNAAKDGATIKLDLMAVDFESPEYIANGDAIDTKYGSASGSVVKVLSSEVKLTKVDSMTNEKAVAGAKNVEVLKFNIDNNKGGEVLVSNVELKVALTDAAATNAGNFQMGLFIDGVQVAGTRNLVSTGTGTAKVTFGNVSVKVPSNGYKNVTVVMDTNNSVVDADAVDDTLKITSVSVEATNQLNGKAVTVTGGTTLASATFKFANSGKLTVTESGTDTNFVSKAVKAGATGIDVFKFSVKADYDKVEMSDVYLKNTSTTTNFNNLGQYQLVDAAGNVVANSTMTANKLKFSLSKKAVVSSTEQVYTVRMNVGSIANASATAAHLKLAIDQAVQENGVEAITAATGADLAATDVTVRTTTTGAEFVAYKSLLALKHGTQSALSYSPTETKIYSFKAIADGEAELGKVSIKAGFTGATLATGAVPNGTATSAVTAVPEVAKLDASAVVNAVPAGNNREDTSLSFSGNATGNGTITINLAGDSIPVTINFGMSNTQVATAVRNAIHAHAGYVANIGSPANVVNVRSVATTVQADATVNVNGTGITAGVLVTRQGGPTPAVASNVKAGTLNVVLNGGAPVPVTITAGMTKSAVLAAIQGTTYAGYTAVTVGDTVEITSGTAQAETDISINFVPTTTGDTLPVTASVKTQGVDAVAATTVSAGSGTYFLLKEKGSSTVLAKFAAAGAAGGTCSIAAHTTQPTCVGATPTAGVWTPTANSGNKSQTLVFELPVNHTIANGSSREYEVFAVGLADDGVAGTDPKADFAILDDAAYQAASNKAGKASQNVVWSDKSAIGHSVSTADWLNGFKLDIDTNAIAVK